MASLHADLLEQAHHLSRREKNKPKQASLRRAVSAAYYALFHFLTDQAAGVFLGASRSPLRNRFRRGFDHGHMKATSASFAGKDPAWLGGNPAPAMLKRIAKLFVEAQQARHDADYNFDARFTRSDAVAWIVSIEAAIADWRLLARTHPEEARSYLMALFAKTR